MKNVLLQISTHWDREWYLTFQGFRYYLVEMMDHLLDALEQGAIPAFVFDGQTVVLEDYLEIRPENRRRLEGLIRAGKLKIGPWYDMPDEFLVSGESLIENFLLGQKVSHSFGVEPWKFGYVNDVFGHIAQFPQILNEFGIHGVYLGRGVDTQYPNGSHLRWKAPDGSECYVFKDNYASFKRAFDEAEDPKKVLLEKLSGTPDEPPVLLNYTDDHAIVDERTSRFLEILSECQVHTLGDFENYGQEMDVHRKALPVLEGELCKTAYLNSDFRTVTNSISSYYPLKQRNDRTENLLYRETGPLLVLGELTGLLTGKRPFFDIARKYLLKNQPHDSICGCSVDAVHNDMPYRYAQAEAIAKVLREEFRTGLASRSAGDGLYLQVLNPDLHKRTGVLTLEIDFPQTWKPVFRDNTDYQRYPLFAVLNADGQEVPYQLLKTEENHELYRRQKSTPVTRCTLALDTRLCPFGVTDFTIVPRERRNIMPPHHPLGLPQTENEYLRLTVESDGTLTVTDKVKGLTYSRLPLFVDDTDSGNGWFHGEANFDTPVITSAGSPTQVQVIHDGDLVHTLRIIKTMQIPARLDRQAYARSGEVREMRITTDVTLRKGQHYLEFHTAIHNDAAEHRVRMLLPTGIEGDTYHTSQAFCFLERPRGSSEQGYNGREREYCEKNTGGIIALDDRFAFVGAEGFHEAGVYPDGTVSVTMLRSVGKMFHQPHAESAKLLGELTYHYALAFHTPQSQLPALQSRLSQAPICLTAAGKSPIGSLMQLSDPRIQISTLKPAEEQAGWILRLYNPTGEEISCTLTAGDLMIRETDLSEKALKQLPTSGRKALTFAPYKLKTLLLTR